MEDVKRVGPRATKGLYRACHAMAAMAGRDDILPDDAKRLYPSVLYHDDRLSALAALG